MYKFFHVSKVTVPNRAPSGKSIDTPPITIATAGVMLLLLVPVASASRRDVDLPPQTVVSPVGDVGIFGIQYDHLVGASFIRCTIVNRTGRNFDSLTLHVAIVDSRGPVSHKRPEEENLAVVSLLAGESRKAEMQLSDKAQKETVSLHFSYVASAFPARYSFEMIEPKGGGNSFVDGTVKIDVRPGRDGISFSLANNGQSALSLDWDKSALIDTDGVAHKLAGGGVRYLQAGASKPPSVVPPGAAIKDTAYSVDSVSFDKVWNISPLLPDCPDCLTLQNKMLGVMFHVSGVGEKDYVFRFRIVGVQ